MNSKLFLSIIMIIFCATPSAHAAAEDYTLNCDLLFGAKYMDESDWQPVHNQALSGINLDIRPFDWPVSLVAAYLYSYNKGEAALLNPAWGFNLYDTTGTTAEARIGVRKTWERNEQIHSYISPCY